MRQAILFGLFAFLFNFNVSFIRCIEPHKLTKIKDVALAHRHAFPGTNVTDARANGKHANDHKNGKGNGNGHGGSTQVSSAASAASVANVGSIASVAIAASATSVAASATAATR